jgi:ATP-dependent Clp protease adapter protein ClpS
MAYICLSLLFWCALMTMMMMMMMMASTSTCSAFTVTTMMPQPPTKGSSTAFVAPTTRPMTPTFMASSGDGGSSGPAVLDPPTKTVEKVVVNDEDKKIQQDEKVNTPGWEIRLFNDPFNKREFVARCLAEVCGKSDTESFQIMMQAHKHGMGIVGRYMFEIAELYYSSLREQGLMVDMVPVDDD